MTKTNTEDTYTRSQQYLLIAIATAFDICFQVIGQTIFQLFLKFSLYNSHSIYSKIFKCARTYVWGIALNYSIYTL